METVVRVAIIYVFILVGLRIMGKREFSQLSPLELITLLLIPELVAQSLVREDFSLTNGIIAITTLFTLVFLTSALVHLNEKAEKIVSGSPSVLVSHGEFIESNLNRERMSPEEVFGEMRKAGLHRLDQVRWAVLESDGKISFIPEDESVDITRQTDEDKIQG